MIEDTEELGFLMDGQLRKLAALFYQSDGRIYDPMMDFKNSTHGEERGCWNKAVIAYAFINKDADLLKYQV
jgi:hypothetical protein